MLNALNCSVSQRLVRHRSYLSWNISFGAFAAYISHDYITPYSGNFVIYIYFAEIYMFIHMSAISYRMYGFSYRKGMKIITHESDVRRKLLISTI